MNLLLSAVNTENIRQAAMILWQGMLGIFIVMTVIFLAVKLLNLFPKISSYADNPDAFDEKTLFVKIMRTKPMSALCKKITTRRDRRAAKLDDIED
ncbi:MAG: hypothetical protein LBT55_07750 [Clostridiaceae bacterium]|jgi:hypothetical protein|nr:hypothetical protein [Clostridiaceae bacterium]